MTSSKGVHDWDRKAYSERLSCARPLLVDSGVSGFEYAFCGSCFLVCFRDRIYAVTAAHCLRNQRLAADDVRIPYAVPADEFIPLRGIHELSTNESSKDHVDIALLEVARDRIPAGLSPHIAAWRLPDRSPCVDSVRPGQYLVTRGFPFELSDIVHDQKRIIRRAFLSEGKYLRQSIELHCHLFQFLNDGVVTTINGMSGSPVFTRQLATGMRQPGRLVGMVIKADPSTSMASYIGWRVICTALEDLAKS